VTLVAILTVRKAALDTFRAFERHAAAIMADHGGRIERTVVVTPAATPDLVKEIHVVTFPDERAFGAYRGDVRRDALAHLREAAVVATEILVGEDGPRYEAGPVSGEGIRDAGPEDHEAIRAVTLAAYAEYAALMPHLWDGYRRNILATLARPAPAAQLVAERAGVIVGTVLLYPTAPARPGADGARARCVEPEVRLLAVAPAARGRGVGAALMGECLRRARASGAPALTLHTTGVMQAAIRVYERLGFVRAPELDVEVAPGLTVSGYRHDFDPAGHTPYHTKPGA
jgi:ribosomal protein S18 acetylase RimI-like enzyme